MITRICNVSQLNAPRLEQLGNDFLKKTLGGTFQTELFLKTWEGLIQQGIGAMWSLTLEGKLMGVIGGIISVDPRDASIVAHEYVYYCESLMGSVNLLDTFVAWTEEIHATRVHIGSLIGYKDVQAKKLYEHRGFRAQEIIYVRTKRW